MQALTFSECMQGWVHLVGSVNGMSRVRALARCAQPSQMRVGSIERGAKANWTNWADWRSLSPGGESRGLWGQKRAHAETTIA